MRVLRAIDTRELPMVKRGARATIVVDAAYSSRGVAAVSSAGRGKIALVVSTRRAAAIGVDTGYRRELHFDRLLATTAALERPNGFSKYRRC